MPALPALTTFSFAHSLTPVVLGEILFVSREIFLYCAYFTSIIAACSQVTGVSGLNDVLLTPFTIPFLFAHAIYGAY